MGQGLGGVVARGWWLWVSGVPRLVHNVTEIIYIFIKQIMIFAKKAQKLHVFKTLCFLDVLVPFARVVRHTTRAKGTKTSRKQGVLKRRKILYIPRGFWCFLLPVVAESEGLGLFWLRV